MHTHTHTPYTHARTHAHTLHAHTHPTSTHTHPARTHAHTHTHTHPTRTHKHTPYTRAHTHTPYTYTHTNAEPTHTPPHTHTHEGTHAHPTHTRTHTHTPPACTHTPSVSHGRTPPADGPAGTPAGTGSTPLTHGKSLKLQGCKGHIAQKKSSNLPSGFPGLGDLPALVSTHIKPRCAGTPVSYIPHSRPSEQARSKSVFKANAKPLKAIYLSSE